MWPQLIQWLRPRNLPLYQAPLGCEIGYKLVLLVVDNTSDWLSRVPEVKLELEPSGKAGVMTGVMPMLSSHVYGPRPRVVELGPGLDSRLSLISCSKKESANSDF